MMLDIKIAFNALANGDYSPIINLAKQRMDEFKKMSFEGKYQTLLRLAVELGDPGMTGDVPTFDRHVQKQVEEGMTSFFNYDEYDAAKKVLTSLENKNPSDEDVILWMRTNYRGEAPPSDEPLKLTLLYDHFRTNNWLVRPEEALLFLEVPEGSDKNLVHTMDCLIAAHFGLYSRPTPQ